MGTTTERSFQHFSNSFALSGASGNEYAVADLFPNRGFLKVVWDRSAIVGSWCLRDVWVIFWTSFYYAVVREGTVFCYLSAQRPSLRSLFRNAFKLRGSRVKAGILYWTLSWRVVDLLHWLPWFWPRVPYAAFAYLLILIILPVALQALFYSIFLRKTV